MNTKMSTNNNFESSYIKFYNRLNSFKGYTKLGLKNEFVSSVNRHDYRKAELDEIIDYLFRNCI